MVIAVQSDTGGPAPNPGFTCKNIQGKTEASCFVQQDDSGTSKYYVALAPNASTDDKYTCESVKIQKTAAQGTACCTPGTSPKPADPEKDPQPTPEAPPAGMTEEQYKSACGKADDPASTSTTEADP
ncbi:hypothetical protein PGTUg99_015488 [Puccinia graminis f. sp. tritici]|uniref:Uncharacterized protein n=1 Tax=Puccinia graminis f. sp. tritici TaxID=56615 RepID=A0A5B0SFQ1_PUCGR|nr:hypothetical protein PGTUg99_015488 [Puccinia graminis f. sp. tritici]